MRTYVAAVVGIALLSACDKDTPTRPDPPPPVAPAAAPTPVPPPTPPPLALTGHWHSEARSWEIQLEQEGSEIRGRLVGFKNVEFSNPAHPDLQITGTVTGTNTVDFKAEAYALRFSGTAESSTEMTGSLFDCVTVCRSYGEVLVKR
ncbi:MAG TPA: hypothetical protein VMT87_02725 [Vicinamibacteria bacterium]|nr:hypothetical protein [Vicinamibacteria bacterium]